MPIWNSSSATVDSPSESSSLRHHERQSSRKSFDCYSQWDGFTVIFTCFFLLSFVVTFALIIQIHYGSPEVTPHGAVATDERLCSEIGTSLMRKGGNAVDVVIASLICLSVTHPHLVGPGGGGVALVHDHKKNFSKVFDFMSGIPEGLSYPRQLDLNGGLKIGVPGFLKGLEVLHKRYGVLSWKDLFKPSIKLAQEGFLMSEQLAKVVLKEQPAENAVLFKKVFFPNGIVITKGQMFTRKKYARFLKDVSENGAKEFYLLKYGTELIEALKAAGSNVTVNDIHSYKVKITNALTAKLNGYDLLTAGLPFGGFETIKGLKYLNNSNIDMGTSSGVLYEAFVKGQSYGAAKLTQAIKLSFKPLNEIKNVHPTDMHIPESPYSLPILPATQVSAVDAFDLYISAVVGLGTNFGSGVMTQHEIILNDQLYGQHNIKEMEDSPSSIWDRPFSSYTPFIVVDSKNVCGRRMILSSGSSSAVMEVLSRYLFRNQNMTSSIVAPRITLNRTDNILLVNEKLSGEVRSYLKDRNYTFNRLSIPLSVNGVSKFRNSLVSHSDTRGGGVAARLHGIGTPETNETAFRSTSNHGLSSDSRRVDSL